MLYYIKITIILDICIYNNDVFIFIIRRTRLKNKNDNCDYTRVCVCMSVYNVNFFEKDNDKRYIIYIQNNRYININDVFVSWNRKKE